MRKTKRYPEKYTIRLKAIGEKLYALRMDRNESLQTVAGKIKMSATILSKIEKGKQNFRLPTLFKICRYYQVEPRDIASSIRT